MCLPEELDTWNRNNRHREQIIGVSGGGDHNNPGGPSGPSSGQDDGAPGANDDVTESGMTVDQAFNQANSNLGIKSKDLFGEMTDMGMIGARGTPAPPSSVPSLPSRGTPQAPGVPGLPDPIGIDTKTPSETNNPTARGTADDPNYGGENDSDPTGTTGSPAGSTAAQSPDQDNTGGFGPGSTAANAANPNAPGDMAATGQAPGVGSGQNETSAGPGSSGGGGDGGGGMGGIGGMGMGDHGVGGSQGTENGQGGWMMGTADTGNDGDMMMDEEVDPPVHEDEAVIPRPMRDDIGEDILAEAIGLYQDQGLTPRERKIALKDLLGEWASRK